MILGRIKEIRSTETPAIASKRSDSEMALKILEKLKLLSRRFAAARIDHNLVGDLLPLGQVPETSTFNRADVNEDIGAAIIRLDETKALRQLNHLTVPVAMTRPFHEQAGNAHKDAGCKNSKLWIGSRVPTAKRQIS